MDAAARPAALDAAAEIHTDMARDFIRYEVIAATGDFVECGSRAEAARRGLQRLEGKEYVVEDGDVLERALQPALTGARGSPSPSASRHRRPRTRRSP